MEARKLFSRLGWALVAQMAAMLAVQAAMLLAGVFIAAGALAILGMQLLWN